MEDKKRFYDMRIEDIEEWEINNDGIVVFCGCSGVAFSICPNAKKKKPLLIETDENKDVYVVQYDDAVRVRDYLNDKF